jgi:hypothetical protein
MGGVQVSRRNLLEGSVALVPGLAILAVGRSAAAFSTETMNAGSSVGLACLVLAGCAEIVLTFCAN